ncbi:MAG TPA: putative toxin-antitoxin system toxin component, PIN family [Candidatus Limnocylindria bacterium]
MPRAVLDPNVLISGLISPRGASARILLDLRAGAFELVVSPSLLAELREVLEREKFRRYVTLDEVHEFVEAVRSAATLAEDPAPSAAPLSDDPDDEYLIALAGATRVDALVSGDPHLTRLRGTIPVRTPREFVDSLARER